jgi:hypothetical protein
MSISTINYSELIEKSGDDRLMPAPSIFSIRRVVALDPEVIVGNWSAIGSMFPLW